MQHGIHHITAIAGHARRNLEFSTHTLGLRLVKKTVNFDDPGSYHFYYGDEVGSPGTILTFFPWAQAASGRLGVGETQETALRVPQAAIGYWTHRFIERGVAQLAPERRFGATVLPFTDPDGTRLALVALEGVDHEPAWSSSEIPAEHAIRGFHGVTLLLEDAGPTAAILSDVLGFTESARDGNVRRHTAEDAAIGGIVDLRAVGGFLKGRQGAGSVHHLAFRAPDDAAQSAMVAKLSANHQIRATPQKDRTYFRSVYFREPGQVLFEIATDMPGFAVDEPAGELGQTLKLPPFLEASRAKIEAALPSVA